MEQTVLMEFYRTDLNVSLNSSRTVVSILWWAEL